MKWHDSIVEVHNRSENAKKEMREREREKGWEEGREEVRKPTEETKGTIHDYF
jgi:hypothetical protein